MKIVLELLTTIVMTLLLKGLLSKLFRIKPEITDNRGSKAHTLNLVLWIVSIISANLFLFAVEILVLSK